MVDAVCPNAEMWRGRRVFLTGHTGFKGSWLALWLAHLGAAVRGYSLRPPGNPNLFEAARVAERTDDVRGDIGDMRGLQAAMAAFAPEAVFHLAAQPLVRRSYADPVETYATNVMGTVHVLEAVRAVPSVRAVVCVTTDKCYLNREWPWGYRELDRLGGHDPYGSSKACAEMVCAAYRASFFTSRPAKTLLATARAGNVIGGGDWAEDRLLPDLLRGCIAGRPVRIRHPHAVRPWQHVLEPLRGYLMLAERLLAGEREIADAWNFGPLAHDARPVEWIANCVCRLWSGAVPWQLDHSAGPHETACLKLDCAKAHSLLQWYPTLGLAESLRLTVDWTHHWQAGDDMQRFTLAQIAAYEAACIAPARASAHHEEETNTAASACAATMAATR